MPKRKATHRGGFYEQKRSRRKKVRRRAKRYYTIPRRSRITRPIKVFPKRSLVELTYCDKVNITTGTAPHIFRLNSLHDPDLTATGHQPRGFDQWKTMYNKYCVIGASVLIEPLKMSGQSGSESFHVFSYIDDDTTSDLYSIEDLRELRMPGTRTKYLTMQADTNVPVTGYKKIRQKVGMKKFFGIAKKTQMFKPSGLGHGDADPHTFYTEQYAASADTNPLRSCYLKLSAEGVEGSTYTVQCRVTIKYMAVMYDPKEIGAS